MEKGLETSSEWVLTGADQFELRYFQSAAVVLELALAKGRFAPPSVAARFAYWFSQGCSLRAVTHLIDTLVQEILAPSGLLKAGSNEDLEGISAHMFARMGEQAGSFEEALPEELTERAAVNQAVFVRPLRLDDANKLRVLDEVRRFYDETGADFSATVLRLL